MPDEWESEEVMHRWAHLGRSTLPGRYLLSVTDERERAKMGVELTWPAIERLCGWVSRERRRLAQEGRGVYGPPHSV